jgi:hypothetical protein
MTCGRQPNLVKSETGCAPLTVKAARESLQLQLANPLASERSLFWSTRLPALARTTADDKAGHRGLLVEVIARAYSVVTVGDP